MRFSRTLIALFIGVCSTFALTGGAHAVVPPRDCGMLTLKGHRYQIKVDQITCADGKTFSRGYVERKVTPRGYACKKFPVKKRRVRFNCVNGRRVFFGILR
jgi:hypothetical protein